ncbi:hypothetical protein N7488_012283 [Penicillium malachiteum]|nr:hypothetical protein N7488_012283 [Penicillium malachiteum]
MEISDKGMKAAPSPRNSEETSRGEIMETRNGQFHCSFSPRQVHVISLGSNIGSGLFIATDKALAKGGPANMIIAYTIVCVCVWSVLQSLSEMTIAFPVSGNYIDYADRWVDPALAFGAGFAEWLAWTALVASEAGFFNVLIQYWAQDSFPIGASITIFIFICLALFLLPKKAFVWFEYVTSLVKIIIFLIIIVLSLALVLSAGPNGHIHRGETWTSLPPFKNGFSGFAECALLATWAVSFIYITSVVFITILIPSNDDRLLGGSGVTASPFVLAVQEAGIPVIGSLLNAGAICGVLAIGAEAVYLSSRILRTMAHQRLIPERLARVDDKGRPRLALLMTSFVATVLS